MWTTNSGQSLTYGTSNDPVTGWTNSRRLRAMLGNTTTGWWAAETLVDGPRHYFASVHDTWIDFWDMVWTSNEAFLLLAPDHAQAISAAFDRADALPGDSVRVELASVGSVGRRLDLQWVRIRGTAVDTLNALDWGLPDSVTVGPDSAVVRFEVSPMLGDGRTCLLSVAAGNAGETMPPDTLAIGLAEIVYTDPPDPPEPIVKQVHSIYVPRIPARALQRAPTASVAWTVDVFDVRGRLCWSGAGRGNETCSSGRWAPRGPACTSRARAPGAARRRVGKFVVSSLPVAQLGSSASRRTLGGVRLRLDRLAEGAARSGRRLDAVGREQDRRAASARCCARAARHPATNPTCARRRDHPANERQVGIADQLVDRVDLRHLGLQHLRAQVDRRRRRAAVRHLDHDQRATPRRAGARGNVGAGAAASAGGVYMRCW
jgi:hypothetical protein